MPGGDGTGPAGAGPMTGRGGGYCAGYDSPGYANPVPGRGRGRGGWGRGMAWGRAWGGGFGRGMGWGRRTWAAGPPPRFGRGVNPYAPELTPEQETAMLKDEAKALQEDLKAINERIGALEKSAKQK